MPGGYEHMADRNLLLLGAAHVHLPDHLRQARDLGWRVTHLHDRDAARRDRLCEKLGAQPVTSFQEFADLPVRAALVCSETCFHETDILTALSAGLPVFSEKPLAGSEGAARLCAAQAAENRLLLHTGYFFRTNPVLQDLKQAVEAGALGKVHSARMRFSHDGGFADWLDLGGWMTDPALAVYGGFADEAVHVLDAMHWILGPVEDAQAVTGNALGWPVDDHGAAILRFASGAVGVAEAGWTDARMRLEADFVGDKGHAKIDDNGLRVFRRGMTAPVQETPMVPLDAGEGLRPFLDHLEGRSASGLVPPADAVEINRLLDLMRLSHGEITESGTTY